MHAGLVVKGRRGCDRGVERDGDAEHLGEHRVELRKHREPVVLDQLRLEGHEPRHHRGERHDAVALPDAEDGCVDVRRARLECRQRIRHGAPGVVVGVKLDIAPDVPPDQRHEVVDLRRCCDADCICEADPIHTGSIDRAIDADQVVRIAAEGVLGAETRFHARRRGSRRPRPCRCR